MAGPIVILFILFGLVSQFSGPDGTTAPPLPDPSAPLVAEPQVPSGRFTTATEVRPILEATRANWVALRDWEGQDLLYITHLWSWRCGLLQIRVGINGATPEIWPMPDCPLDSPTPAAILDSDGLPYLTFEGGSVQEIAVEITYDDLSSDSVVFSRAQVLMP